MEGGRGGFKIENEFSCCGGREWVSIFWVFGCFFVIFVMVNMIDS